MAMKLWRLDLICCGRADTHIVRDTWGEADQFRQDYIKGDGHDRQAILSEDHAHTGFCNGYSDGCPLPGGSFLEVR